MSDDIPTPGQALAVGDGDQYCFLAPSPQCELDITLTSYSGEQDHLPLVQRRFRRVAFDTESDNLRQSQSPPLHLFFALIIYTPNVTGVYTPGRYNIVFHTNCSDSHFDHPRSAGRGRILLSRGGGDDGQ